MVSIAELQRLAGIRSGWRNSVREQDRGSNISVTAAEKARLMKQHNIEPGTPAWFQLWFSLPYLTGEKPVGPTRHRK